MRARIDAPVSSEPATIDAAAAERRFTHELRVPVLVDVAHEPVRIADLHDEEARSCAALRGAARLDSWLRGRAALKALLTRASMDEGTHGLLGAERTGSYADTSGIRFPHPRLSLTHSGAWAVAAGTPSDDAAGLGIDLELARGIREGAERFFLGAEERLWLHGLPHADRSRESLRLWTTKEALFKANAGNEGTLLVDYVLDDPGEGAGAARWKAATGAVFRYASLALAGGAALTLAVRFR